MVIENASIVPILYDQSVTMLQNNISGYPINPLSVMILKRVKKK